MRAQPLAVEKTFAAGGEPRTWPLQGHFQTNRVALSIEKDVKIEALGISCPENKSGISDIDIFTLKSDEIETIKPVSVLLRFIQTQSMETFIANIYNPTFKFRICLF